MLGSILALSAGQVLAVGLGMTAPEQEVAEEEMPLWWEAARFLLTLPACYVSFKALFSSAHPRPRRMLNDSTTNNIKCMNITATQGTSKICKPVVKLVRADTREYYSLMFNPEPAMSASALTTQQWFECCGGPRPAVFPHLLITTHADPHVASGRLTMNFTVKSWPHTVYMMLNVFFH